MTRKLQITSLLVCVLTLVPPMSASDQPVADDSVDSRPAASSEIEFLKKMLADQQRQIDELRRQLAGGQAATNENKKVDVPPAYPSTGQVASTTPIVPPSPAPIAPPVFNSTAPTLAPPPQHPDDATPSPLQLKIGD